MLLETEYGPAVLRQYLRGGWPARISRDLYLFTGYQRSRPLAEFRMLAGLSDMGLPVPAPLAALCARQGLRYRGWLLLERILQAVPLADLIMGRADDDALWRRCGAVIRRFHAAGVVHADLNARNILVGQGPAVHLVDFDRARLAVNDAAAFRANLARLRRSLEKLWPDPLRDRLQGCWKQLEDGYARAGEAV
ncbi:MAG: 3-deoxy-D-manno-octulosonic acid kinase [Lysobacterales bacterium]|nr:MAG: 3-deoxy-D-manno-octulosonic acid kinase [Xanthomonadales bacterium]